MTTVVFRPSVGTLFVVDDFVRHRPERVAVPNEPITETLALMPPNAAHLVVAHATWLDNLGYPVGHTEILVDGTYAA